MKIRMRRLLIALGAALYAGLAGCGSPTGGDGGVFAPAEWLTPLSDERHDGRHQTIQRALQTSWRGIFREYDRNRDGVITPAEAPWAPGTFRELDRDGDGRLTQEEVHLAPGRLDQMTELVASAWHTIFQRADRNEDGRLNRSELDGAEELKVFQQSAPWQAVVRRYDIAFAPLTLVRFESFMQDLLQQTDEQRQNEPPLHNLGGKVPVLLVQGYMEPSWYFLSGIYLFLKKKDWPVMAMNLFPNIGDIREQARLLQLRVDEILKQTGAQRINLVVHSMGGLISRYYIQDMDGVRTVEHLVTIATPHHGTYVALVGIGQGARQMEPGSQFLRDLNAQGGIYPPVRYTSAWTPTDEIVVPASSARLDGSDIRPPVTSTGHLLILLDKRTYESIWSAIRPQAI